MDDLLQLIKVLLKIYILILDDEETLLEICPSILKKYLSTQFYLITIKDGDDAFRILRDSNMRFDLIITDIMHLGESCFDIIKFVGKNIPETKVLIISATGGMFSKEQLSLADAYLPKPFKIETDFLDVVKSLLCK